ncbi:hypothetical protein [Nocardioides sp. WS12]|nr:hypothetical protein [Nocardioides sp. WS12]
MSADKKQQRKEQLTLLKELAKGARKDPKGAAIFFRDIIKEKISKKR